MEYREDRNTGGTQRTVENGIEQRVQRSTWSTERTGTQGENSTWSTESTVTLGEHRTVENGREQRV